MRLSSNEDFISTRIAWKRTGRGTWQQAVPSETPSQRCEQALELAKGMKRNKLPKDLNIDNQGLPHSKRGRTGPSDQKDCKRRLCGGTPTATQVYVFLPQTTHRVAIHVAPPRDRNREDCITRKGNGASTAPRRNHGAARDKAIPTQTKHKGTRTQVHREGGHKQSTEADHRAKGPTWVASRCDSALMKTSSAPGLPGSVQEEARGNRQFHRKRQVNAANRR